MFINKSLYTYLVCLTALVLQHVHFTQNNPTTVVFFPQIASTIEHWCFWFPPLFPVKLFLSPSTIAASRFRINTFLKGT